MTSDYSHAIEAGLRRLHAAIDAAEERDRPEPDDSAFGHDGQQVRFVHTALIGLPIEEEEDVANSASVDLKCLTAADAQRFYFNAPGEGTCSGVRVYKCVEGDAEAARQLVRMARKQRRETLEIDEYRVED